MSKLLSQGGFGCVFYPAFNCSGKVVTSNNIVSKLQLDTFHAHNEVYIGSRIKQIPNYNLYFLPVISSCSIGIGLLNKKYIEKCKIVSNKDPNYLLLELPYVKNISFPELFLDLSHTSRYLFLIFIETFRYLITSIEHLLKKNIVHYDLKEDNILYSVKYENPILIDFGISIPMDKLNTSKLKEYFYVYAPDYYIWPLEVHVINFLINKKDKLLLQDIEDMVETYVSHNSALQIFSKEFKRRYKIMCIDILKKYENVNKNIIIKELLTYYKTWDLYSLSILYLKFYAMLFKNGF